MEQTQRQRYLESVSVIATEMQLLSLAKQVGEVKELWHLAQESPRLLLRLRCQAQEAHSSQLNLTHLWMKGKREKFREQILTHTVSSPESSNRTAERIQEFS